MSEEKQPKSPDEFDYFADEAEPADAEDLAAAEGLPQGLEQQLAVYRKEKRARGRYVVLALLALASSIWFLSDYREWMIYVFSSNRQPLDLGDVTAMKPSDIPHNAYVRLTGITEHRGLTQKLVRGLSLNRRELWYYRLLGSQGVFIEVEPDVDRFSPITAVDVRGRVVDPDREPSYARLLAAYDAMYHPQERPARRVIQVGVLPGDNRWPFLAAFVFLALVFGANSFVIARYFRVRRELGGRGLFRG